MKYSYKPRARAKYLAHPIFKGMSLRDLEHATRENRVQLARFLKGQPSPDRIGIAIAKVLKCRVSDLPTAS